MKRQYSTKLGNSKFGSSIGIMRNGKIPISFYIVLNGRYFTIFKGENTGKIKVSYSHNIYRKQNQDIRLSYKG